MLTLTVWVVSSLGLGLAVAHLAERREPRHPRAARPAPACDPYRGVSIRPELARRLLYQAPETWAFWIALDRRTP